LGLLLLYLIPIAIVFILLIINELLGLGLNLENENFLNIFVIIVGLICVIVTYNLLKKKWEKEAIIKEDEISDIGISTKE
jgi:arginine exporter protein ArgO